MKRVTAIVHTKKGTLLFTPHETLIVRRRGWWHRLLIKLAGRP